MSLRITFSSVLLAITLIFPVAGQVPRVPPSIQELMQQRQYEAAVSAMDNVQAGDDVDLDYLAYLRGRALHLQEKYDEAISAYQQMQQEHPDSPYARQARFAAAVSHVRRGDFRTAEKIYREEAQYLLSVDRKQQLAEIYLEFADGYFKPAEAQQKPDYAKAMQFYRQALELGPRDDKRREVELLVGRCLQKLNQLDEAIAHFQTFVDQHLDHPEAIEARYLLGETQLQKQDKVAARRTWQDLLELHGQDLSPRIAEAMFNLSLTYGLPTPANAESLSLGVAALQRFLAKYPQHKLASAAYLRIAQSYQHRGRYEDSVAALIKFLGDPSYAEREEIPDARFLLGGAYKLQRKFDSAVEVWQEYLQKHPTHRLWSTVQQQIIDTEYLKALDLYNEKKTQEARTLLSEFLVRYPLDARCRFGPVDMAHHWGMPAFGGAFGTESPEPGTWQAAADVALDPLLIGQAGAGSQAQTQKKDVKARNVPHVTSFTHQPSASSRQ